MIDCQLRERIIFLYYTKDCGVSKIAWILDISKKDVKRALNEYKKSLEGGNQNAVVKES